MGRARGKGRAAKNAKKAANDREETKKFFNQRELGPPPKEKRRARAAPAEPKLDQFAGKRFHKDDEKHTAVVDEAIAAARKAGHRETKDLIPYVWNATRFRRRWKGLQENALTRYVRDQCAEEDRSGRARPFYDGIEDIVKAKDEKLLEFVKRRGVVAVVKSCCGKQVKYGAASGLRLRNPIAFSVEEHGLAGATRLARRETYTTLGVFERFEKQLKELT